MIKLIRNDCALNIVKKIENSNFSQEDKKKNIKILNELNNKITKMYFANDIENVKNTIKDLEEIKRNIKKNIKEKEMET